MRLPWVLLLLGVCAAPVTRSQKPDDARLAEKDVLCHPEGCYAVFLQRRSFREAGRSCRERGGTLATLHDEGAAAVVHQLLAAVEPQGARARLRLWVGLHRAPRQCSATRPLRGFVWVTGDQDGRYTNWLREETPGACIGPRCVALTVHASDSASDSADNFRWLDGTCGLGLDGYICQYTYKGMCPPLEGEGRGQPTYTTPFQLVSALLTHVPFGSVAALPCPADEADPEAPSEQTVLCMEREEGGVGWSRDPPLCSSNMVPQQLDWCSGDHGCEQLCSNTDQDYVCSCSEGFTLHEDGYGCTPDTPDPLSQTEPPPRPPPPTEPPPVSPACVAAGCEYDCVETARGVRCTCPPGYQVGRDGRGCSDVDECRQQPCLQLCVNTPGTFHCACHHGYQQDNEGECVDVDECLDEGTCEGSCENTEGSFTCLCNPGYQQGGGGECVDVDECQSEAPCQQQCLNYDGGFQCYCDNGYELHPDRLTCQPLPEDEEYSTLTPDLMDGVGEPSSDSYALPNSDSNPDHDLPWFSSFTPDPNFETDPDFESDWLTEIPGDMAPPPGSDAHLNQWEGHSPKHQHTAAPPTHHHNLADNQLDNEADVKTGAVVSEVGDKQETRGGSEAPNSPGSNPGTVAKAGGGGSGGERGTRGGAMEEKAGKREDGETEDTGETGGSTAGKRKHDKSWLLVALLVPLCVFLVVMLALGIVYCTSCAVDKSQSFSDCYRWILPVTPPGRSNAKPPA